MGLKLYMLPYSPPSRSVLLTIKALGLEVENVLVNIIEGEHLKPEFVKLNPQHTVPTLQDDDFVIWDSHAINAYLVNKYGKSDSLYPKDPKERAVVDQRLHFDSATLFSLMVSIIRPIVSNGPKEVPTEKQKEVHNAYKLLDTFLSNKKWMAGDFLSIADFNLITSLCAFNIFVPFKNDYPNISRWVTQCEDLPYYDVHKVGHNMFAELIAEKLKQ